MSEYNIEYCGEQLPEKDGVFSVEKELSKLKKGEFFTFTCEGLKFAAISKDDYRCYLHLPDKTRKILNL